MNEFLLKRICYDSKEYWHWVRLREIVLRLPLGLRFSLADLSQDIDEEIYAAFHDDHMIGGVQYAIVDQKAKMRQVAIAHSAQSKGYGQKMVLESEQRIVAKGVKYIYCHARWSAVSFYKSIGYEVISEEFLEVGIPHVKMSKKILE